MKIIAAIFLCFILSGCGRENAELLASFQKSCAVPVRMDLYVSAYWASVEAHCDKVLESAKK